MEKKSVPNRGAGGKARAESLTPERRRDIARRAAAAKWSIPCASHEGTLNIGGWKNIPCWVLDDERRIISQRSFMVIIGMPNSVKMPIGERVSQILDPRNLRSESVAKFISAVETPIRFLNTESIQTQGYEGSIIVEFCRAVLFARRVGNLVGGALEYADQAERLLAAIANTGIDALIDEATGYQEVRAKDALAQILEKYIAQELQPWTKTFPDLFYQEIYRLRKWDWLGEKRISRPQVIAKWTNDFIYDRLAPGVREELCAKNPVTDSGRRKDKHHQWLTGDVGHPQLRSHLEGVIRLLRGCKTWGEFKNFLDRFYPKIVTTELGFEIAATRKPLPESTD
jgi:hypothetical protein